MLATSLVAAAWLAALATIQPIDALRTSRTTTSQLFAERLRQIDEQYNTRVKGIENRLEKLENTIMLSLERSQIASERLEQRMLSFWTNAQQDLVKVNKRCCGSNGDGAAEILAQDSLALANATRRELADAVRHLSRKISEYYSPIDKRLASLVKSQDNVAGTLNKMQHEDSLWDNQLSKNIVTFMDNNNEKLEDIINVTYKTHNAVIRKHQKLRDIVERSPAEIEKAVATLIGHKLKPSMKQGCPGLSEIKSLSTKLVELTERADKTVTNLQEKLHQVEMMQKLAVSWPTEKPAEESDSTSLESDSVAQQTKQLVTKIHPTGDRKDDRKTDPESYDDDLEDNDWD